MPKFTNRLQHAWNAFRFGETDRVRDYGPGFYYSPQRVVRRIGTERSIVMALYNRISMDVAAIAIKHVRMDEDARYVEDINSGLNSCLTLEANIDQTSRAFIQDVVLSMLEEGVVAIVPVDTTINPTVSGAYDILSMRTGKITQWYPSHVEVEVYNDRDGKHERVKLPKTMIAIVENPFYSVMNEPNSTLQRLIRKLNLLDDIDEQSGSGKLDLIIQLPYVIKSEARRLQAEQRRKDIEMQLAGSKYGIAYTDGAERITQLNRAVDNNLMKQVEYLTSMLYSQLGMTEEILKGTADEKVNLNYMNNTIEPIISAICNELKRKFLTKTARTKHESIVFFREPFKLVPVNNIAEIADKFTRNEIMTSNEIRQIIGMKPSDDPSADELRNKNLNQPATDMGGELAPEIGEQEGLEEVSDDSVAQSENDEQDYLQMLEELDNLDIQLDELEKLVNGSELKHYSSPYYDPIKAHEYYMRTRQLKGRRSTAGLNDEGKAAVKYVRSRLQEEKKATVSTSREKKTESLKRQREKTKAEIKTHKEQTQSKIDSIKASIKAMSPAERRYKKESLNKEIAQLRVDNKAKRDALNAAYKQFAERARNEHKSTVAKAKADYDSKLDAEISKIQNSSNFQKKKKTTSKPKYTIGVNLR